MSRSDMNYHGHTHRGTFGSCKDCTQSVQFTVKATRKQEQQEGTEKEGDKSTRGSRAQHVPAAHKMRSTSTVNAFKTYSRGK
ncbi:hypothetical protein ACOMHN_037917 [Nucella lapillus]